MTAIHRRARKHLPKAQQIANTLKDVETASIQLWEVAHGDKPEVSLAAARVQREVNELIVLMRDEEGK